MSSNVPDLTKIGAMPSPQNMNISTSIIEPIHHDESFCRFVLMNRGILHSNSKLQLAIVLPGAHGVRVESVRVRGRHQP